MAAVELKVVPETKIDPPVDQDQKELDEEQTRAAPV
jgi:hypothetical protein